MGVVWVAPVGLLTSGGPCRGCPQTHEGSRKREKCEMSSPSGSRAWTVGTSGKARSAAEQAPASPVATRHWRGIAPTARGVSPSWGGGVRPGGFDRFRSRPHRCRHREHTATSAKATVAAQHTTGTTQPPFGEAAAPGRRDGVGRLRTAPPRRLPSGSRGAIFDVLASRRAGAGCSRVKGVSLRRASRVVLGERGVVATPSTRIRHLGRTGVSTDRTVGGCCGVSPGGTGWV